MGHLKYIVHEEHGVWEVGRGGGYKCFGIDRQEKEEGYNGRVRRISLKLCSAGIHLLPIWAVKDA